VWIQVRVDEDVPSGTVIENTASVSSDTPDPDGSDDTATEETTVEQPAPGLADLSITKADGPDPVVAGELLTYTLQVVNHGPSDARTCAWWTRSLAA
jgi:hypothetical protein